MFDDRKLETEKPRLSPETVDPSWIRFYGGFGKPLTVDFAGLIATSDGGLLRLKQTDTKLNFLPRITRYFCDARPHPRPTFGRRTARTTAFDLALGEAVRNDPDRLRPNRHGGADLRYRWSRDRRVVGTANRISLPADRVHAEP